MYYRAASVFISVNACAFDRLRSMRLLLSPRAMRVMVPVYCPASSTCWMTFPASCTSLMAVPPVIARNAVKGYGVRITGFVRDLRPRDMALLLRAEHDASGTLDTSINSHFVLMAEQRDQNAVEGCSRKLLI